MNWRFWISNHEIFVIDGREIVIINESDNQFPKLRRVIRLVCRTGPIAQHFPKITFLISAASNPLEEGRADVAKFLMGELVIHINSARINEKDKLFERYYTGLILHELTHLYHESKSQFLVKSMAKKERLSALINQKLKSQKTNFKIATIRLYLDSLIRNILPEGLAEYFQKFSQDEVIFSEQNFSVIYLSEVGAVGKVVNIIPTYLLDKSLLLTKEVRENLDFLFRYLNYSTGYHMIYTIIFVDHKTIFEDIIHFQPFEFIRKYEECMEIKGLQPVISVTSGKGVLDYKKMLAQLTAAAKEVQKKSSK